mgnify:CR=1 FL=1
MLASVALTSGAGAGIRNVDDVVRELAKDVVWELANARPMGIGKRTCYGNWQPHFLWELATELPMGIGKVRPGGIGNRTRISIER